MTCHFKSIATRHVVGPHLKAFFSLENVIENKNIKKKIPKTKNK